MREFGYLLVNLNYHNKVLYSNDSTDYKNQMENQTNDILNAEMYFNYNFLLQLKS